MIPELGNFACMLALAVTLVQGIVPIAGSFNGNQRWMALARPAAGAQFLLISVAFACLIYAFVTNDFTVTYVASNSNSSLPVYYRVAGAWGGHEGSLLLWIWMLVMWGFAVALFSRQLPDQTVARVLGVMGLVGIGFLAFLLFTSNPFDRLLPGAPDGRDLNPLLQDFGMIIHPPLLYMGYVGFSVAFAFAIAALMGGQLDAAWARWSRPWTTVAWMFLTLGIFMGSFWAYYELGWGGWWFWDPVENASFMPWLVGTALIHSLAVTEKRGSFKNWTVLLAIIAFSLSLLGTFLVRSGVLTSVHAFATDPERGLFILIFLAIVIGGSLLLYAWRAPSVGLGGSFALVSRESALLVNNVLLLVASGTVLLGTLYPLFLDALGLGKISVGPPYFEAVFVPLMIPVLVLMAAAPFVRWKEASLPELLRRLRWVAVAAVGVAVALALVLAASPMVAAGLAFAIWIVFASVSHIVERARHAPADMPVMKRLAREPRSYWAMQVAHVGIGVFVVGVTMVTGFDDQKDVNMHVGQTATVNDYVFTMKDLNEVKGPNYIAARGTFEVVRNGKLVTTLYPEKRIYNVQKMPMTEAGIDRGFTRDLYVSLGEATQDGAWIVRVQHKPFVGWIWGGCIIMALGGLLAASDRRYRVAASQKKEAAAQLAAKPV
ncbi:MAG TPA: heme lyase CcmF/NrfE family subunit [Noviherbaspirillum sp.]|nr:heme lyase CcmF/NrfE family subunit [Noviherbaspirillum sp.]